MKSFIISSFLFLSLTSAIQQPSAKIKLQMKNNTADSANIAEILTNIYFKGIYEGDVQRLESIYYSGTLLFGDAAGKPYFKTIAQYLNGVKNRQSPKDSGKPFQAEIISIRLVNSIAVAEVKVKMYDFNYHEFLSFHKLEGNWLIVNKMISDVSD
jgi:hypothetical protein